MNNPYKIFILLWLGFLQLSCNSNKEDFKIEVAPSTELMTEVIQDAIEKCGESGGGTVLFKKGKFISGGLYMKSNVTLQFEKGAVLEGSDKLEDYGEWKWTNALIMGDDLKNIAIIGEGLLDGIDLKNPKGEAGFRGPHGIRFTNCDSITIKDITITRSANWAMNFRHCGYGTVHNVKVRGGHDALHTRFCNNFDVRDCDFRTGDDAFAGNDNRDFYIENCKINTSCNAFRFGCRNLIAKNCLIWGPGEYKHIKQNRNNTLSAFVHFSPEDENPKPKIKSGNWLIQNFTIKNVDQIFNYNFDDGLWQTGQPATDIVFESLQATNVKKAFYIDDDDTRTLELTLRNVSIAEMDDDNDASIIFEDRTLDAPSFFNAKNFKSLEFRNVILKSNDADPPMHIQDGSQLISHNFEYTPSETEFDAMVNNVDEVLNQEKE